MRNKFLVICTLAALVAPPSFAQEKAAANAGITRWTDTMPLFVDATNIAIKAEAQLLGAVGLNEQVAAVAGQSKDLSRESNPGSVEQIMAARSAAAALLATKLGTDGLTLDAAAKQHFGDGIDGLARAMHMYQTMTVDLPGLKELMRNSGAKGRTGLFVAKSLPDYIRGAKQELVAAVTFARANNIAYAVQVNEMIAP